MQLKAADDRQADLNALEALLARPDVDRPTRRKIETEIRQIRAGVAGERDAAYEIEFQYGESTNYCTIHDLRIEVGSRVAQIDHLILTRVLDVWIIESKHFADGVRINDRAEWSTLYGRVERGIPSPIEQNNRHAAVLEEAFSSGAVALPRRLGLVQIKPRIQSLVLISNQARIQRPGRAAAKAIDGLDTVIKAERLRATIDRAWDARSSVVIAKAVGPERLADFGRSLAALHRPIAFDWLARFGLSPTPPAVAAPAPELATSDTPEDAGTPRACAACARTVSDAVVAYCAAHAERFAGRILCYDCQRKRRRVDAGGNLT